MLHEFFLGMTLGFGAAVPIGPINLEMIRRNINHGFWSGFMIGIGACLADITYLSLLAIGILYFLTDAAFLKYFGYAGALVLSWFAYQSFKNALSPKQNQPQKTQKSKTLTCFSGYYLTLLNPYTVLFWSSVSFILISAGKHAHSFLAAGTGVVFAIFIWIISLNSIVHHTRHFFSDKANRWLNGISGFILLGFAVLALIKG